MADSKFEGLEPLLRRLVRMAAQARNRRQPLREAAQEMAQSIRENFDAGGRPAKWQAHALSTRRRVIGPRRVLIRSGKLRNSFKPQATNDEATATSNVVYGPRQHFGYPGGKGRGRSRTPARPFAMLQDEDVDSIGRRIFARHLFE